MSTRLARNRVTALILGALVAVGLLLAVLIAVPSRAHAAVLPVGQTAGWNETYGDEFNGTTLGSDWGTCYNNGSCTNAGNKEWEDYTPANVSVGGGDLTLTTHNNGPSALPVTSGMISNTRYSFTYGFFEIRAQMPDCDGCWPAFWALPANGQWPPEIDSVELFNSLLDPDTAAMTYHWDASNQQDESSYAGPNLTTGFHTYGVDWEPGSITWYVDGVARKTFTNASVIANQPMYLIANLAVDTGHYPADGSKMSIDYIRVWQHAAGTPTPSSSSAAPVPLGVPGNWTLAFDDEFNGTSLDTSKWTAMTTNMNNTETSPSNVAVAGGNAVLTLVSPSSGAEICTCNSSTNFALAVGGYAEARVYFPGDGTSIDNWPAWWTSGPNWPAAGENDVAEGLGTLTVNYHSPSGAHNQGTIPGVWSNGFHVYGIYRMAHQVAIYYDGKLVRTYPTDDNGQGQSLIVNVGPGNTAAYGAASQVKVDYVRAWNPASGTSPVPPVSVSPSPLATPTVSSSAPVTVSPVPSATPSGVPTLSPTTPVSVAPTVTSTPLPSIVASPTLTPTVTAQPSVTVTPSPTLTPTLSPSPVPPISPSPVATVTVSVVTPSNDGAIAGTTVFDGTETGANRIEVWYDNKRIATATIKNGQWATMVDTTKQPNGLQTYKIWAWSVPAGQQTTVSRSRDVTETVHNFAWFQG